MNPLTKKVAEYVGYKVVEYPLFVLIEGLHPYYAIIDPAGNLSGVYDTEDEAWESIPDYTQRWSSCIHKVIWDVITAFKNRVEFDIDISGGEARAEITYAKDRDFTDLIYFESERTQNVELATCQAYVKFMEWKQQQ